jgi:phage baseplate assembly protein V
MIQHGNGLTNRIARFVNAVIGWGRIKTLNDAGGAQKVQVQVNARETIDNLPRIAEFGLASAPPDESDVVMVNFGGGRNNAAVIATNHQASRPKNLKSGETMLYSQDGKSVYLTASGGIVVDAKGQAVTVNNASTVTINAATKVRMVTPLLEVTGDIIDNAATNPHTMAQMRSIYNTHTHPVPNVQLGGPGTATSAPSETE